MFSTILMRTVIRVPRSTPKWLPTDRDLRLAGYEVYRFGGFELHEPTACDSFFRKLFQKHGLWNSRRECCPSVFLKMDGEGTGVRLTLHWCCVRRSSSDSLLF